MWRSLFLILAASVAQTYAQELTCVVTTAKGTFDLSPLRLLTSNYNLYVDSYKQFLINICKPLTEVTGTWCSFYGEPAVCLHSPWSNRARTLGSHSEAYFDTLLGDIKLIYPGGEKCGFEENYFSTSIEFRCDPQAGKGLPTFHSLTNCTLHIHWYTSHVCTTRGRAASSSAESCSYVEPETGLAFDLQPLSLAYGKSYKVNSIKFPGQFYELNICQKVASSGPCMDSGSCLFGPMTSQNFGSYNVTGFHRTTNSVILTMEEGHACPGGDKLETRVDLICDRHAGFGKPKLKEENLCQTRFEWKTIHACDTPAPVCKWRNFDLSELNRGSSDWKIKDVKGYRYDLSICTPLVRQQSCDGDSMLCRAKSDYSKRAALGKYWSQFIEITPDHELRFLYDGGVQCKNSTSNSSVAITFKCSAITENPRLVNDTGEQKCHTDIVWNTPLACGEPKIEVPFYKNILYDARSEKAIDISPLFTYVGKVDEWRFNFGGNDTECGEALCYYSRSEMSAVGKWSTLKFFKKSSLSPVTMQLSSNVACNVEGDKFYSHITLICSKTREDPVYLHDSRDCGRFFEWRVPEVCPENERSMTPAEWSRFAPHFQPLVDHIVLYIVLSCIVTLALVSTAGVILYIFLNPERRRTFLAKFSKMAAEQGDDSKAIIFQDHMTADHA